jgi:hypothetical protein
LTSGPDRGSGQGACRAASRRPLLDRRSDRDCADPADPRRLRRTHGHDRLSVAGPDASRGRRTLFGLLPGVGKTHAEYSQRHAAEAVPQYEGTETRVGRPRLDTLGYRDHRLGRRRGARVVRRPLQSRRLSAATMLAPEWPAASGWRLAAWRCGLREKTSVRTIAAEPGRSPSMISREMRRNGTPQVPQLVVVADLAGIGPRLAPVGPVLGGVGVVDPSSVAPAQADRLCGGACRRAGTLSARARPPALPEQEPAAASGPCGRFAIRGRSGHGRRRVGLPLCLSAPSARVGSIPPAQPGARPLSLTDLTDLEVHRTP